MYVWIYTRGCSAHRSQVCQIPDPSRSLWVTWYVDWTVSGPLSMTVGILNCQAISFTNPLVVFHKDYIIKLLQLHIKRKLPTDKELSENTIKPWRLCFTNKTPEYVTHNKIFRCHHLVLVAVYWEIILLVLLTPRQGNTLSTVASKVKTFLSCLSFLGCQIIL